MKNSVNYQKLEDAYLENLYKKNNRNKENFFMAYAVEGPMMVPEYGLRQDLPARHPIKGPVKKPSPLNSERQFI